MHHATGRVMGFYAKMKRLARFGVMGLRRFHTDSQEAGNFLIALTFGEKLKDFTLPRSQSASRRRVERAVRACWVADGLRQTGRQVRFVAAKSVNSSHQVTIRIVLQDISVSPCSQNLLDEQFGVVHGQNEDFRLWREFTNLAGGLDSV